MCYIFQWAGWCSCESISPYFIQSFGSQCNCSENSGGWCNTIFVRTDSSNFRGNCTTACQPTYQGIYFTLIKEHMIFLSCRILSLVHLCYLRNALYPGFWNIKEIDGNWLSQNREWLLSSQCWTIKTVSTGMPFFSSFIQTLSPMHDSSPSQGGQVF
mgnify:CR=1 FL=1